MPALLWVGGAAVTGWLMGFFSSDAMSRLLRWALILAALVGFFYAYRVTAKG